MFKIAAEGIGKRVMLFSKFKSLVAKVSAPISKVTEVASSVEGIVPKYSTNISIPAALTPLKLGVGVNAAASNAKFKSAIVPTAVKLALSLPEPPNVMLVVPIVKVPPVMVKVI